MRSHLPPDPWGHDPRDQRQQQFEPTAPSVWQDSEDSTFAVPGRNHRARLQPKQRGLRAGIVGAGLAALLLGAGALAFLG
jgi:hypothetical protein